MEKILLIDDEPNILNAFRRKLTGQYEVLVGGSGSEALTILQQHPDIAVIITDMQMPGMSGIELLKEIHTRSPDAIRVMLTGLADQKTVVRAINEGSIFKFLNKPCSVDELERVIADAVIVRKLHAQEKMILQQTLSGTVKLVTDIVSLIDPLGAEKASLMRKLIKDLGKFTGITASELELAPLLSGIGKVGHEPNKSQVMTLSATLLKQIPRFDKISKVLEAIAAPQMVTSESMKNIVHLYQISEMLTDHLQEDEDFSALLKRASEFLSKDQREFLARSHQNVSSPEIKPGEEGYLVELRELCPGQMLMSDIVDSSGKLLLKSGFMLTKATIERIATYQLLIGVQTPIRVAQRIPTRD